MTSRRRYLALLFLTFAALAQPPSKSVLVARKALDLLLAQRYGEFRALFNDELLKKVSDNTMRGQIGPQIAALGTPQTIGVPEVRKTPGLAAVLFPVKFSAGNFVLVISVDDSGKLSGFAVNPGPPQESTVWTSPPYSRPEMFRMREVIVGDGQWRLPGSLLTPLGKGPFPAVVLVHGSGPQDRDGSVSLDKPLRDLAEGLASRGIVVLRYDKRTQVYPAQVAALKSFTLAQETTDDAVKALAFLRAQPQVDSKHIFVVAQDLGAYAGPRIAAADAKLAGLALMAARVRPLETSALGAPASYALELKDYNPTVAAQSLKCRILVLQGSRDSQLASNDFASWRSALAGRSNVKFHEYPALNHLFISGEGKPSPAESRKLGHVSEDVVIDLAIWVNSLT